MGMLEVARDTLKDLPISDVIRERLSLALDRLAEAEAKIESLHTEIGGLKAQELLREEVRVVFDGEFRKGVRTGGQWLPFCPKCHLPLAYATEANRYAYCSDQKCGWVANTQSGEMRSQAKGLS